MSNYTNTIKFAKQLHRNRHTTVKTKTVTNEEGKKEDVKYRVRNEDYVSLKEFIRNNPKSFSTVCEGKLADILGAR